MSPEDSQPTLSRQEAANERRERRRQRKEYYQKGLSTGEPAACLLYKLALALHLEDNYLLW